MLPRTFSPDEVKDFLANRNDPKTMDYYIYHLVNIKVEGGICHDGTFSISLSSSHNIKSEAFRHIKEIRNKKKAHPGKSDPLMFFAMHLFEGQFLPKCRTIGIVSKYSCNVEITNPIAGTTTTHSYGPSGTMKYQCLAPPTIHKSKYMVIYRRSAWDRKGELKITDADEKDDDTESNEDDAVPAVAESDVGADTASHT